MSPTSNKVVLDRRARWLINSERATELYSAGRKLWTKEDLLDIEQQLTNSCSMARFSIRQLDGRIIEVVNSRFHKESPNWKPYVEFHAYWQLMHCQPDDMPTEYQSSYRVEWADQTANNLRGLQAQPEWVLDEKDLLWRNSSTRKMLSSLVEDLLGKGSSAKKVVCFGLGDFSRSAPEWFKEDNKCWGWKADVEHSANPMIQHAVALTMARLCGNEMGSLYAQDPDYTEATEEILTKKKFQIVGRYGAGGFAEIDDDSIVISPFPNAPVKQIIAELARPVIIISHGWSVFNKIGHPFVDADSPRTAKMLSNYDTYSIPTDPEEVEGMMNHSIVQDPSKLQG
ncbi:hypothetical protein N7488_009806 [Penicillium malachiteum]|nr:hypothetical protein N7488_009806 [Penicillium malachiteum]